MYHRLYSETAHESHPAQRQRERQLLEIAIGKLEQAKARGIGSPEASEATTFLRQLWTVFVTDLSDDENSLPASLKASLISIGLWMSRETDLIDAGQSENFDGLIEINRIVADGLM